MKKVFLSAPFAPAFENVLRYEGGYQCRPNDSGNYYNGKLTCTNRGITGAAYFNYYKKEPTQEIIKNLTVSQVKPIYKKNYWDYIKGDDIQNDSVANLLFDIVVNSGVGMTKSFRQLMNETAGKKIVNLSSTPFTSPEIKLLNALPPDRFFSKVKKWREAFYKALVAKKPEKAEFLKGWLDRLNKHTYSGKKSTPTSLYIAGALLLFSGGAYLGYKVG